MLEGQVLGGLERPLLAAMSAWPRLLRRSPLR